MIHCTPLSLFKPSLACPVPHPYASRGSAYILEGKDRPFPTVKVVLHFLRTARRVLRTHRPIRSSVSTQRSITFPLSVSWRCSLGWYANGHHSGTQASGVLAFPKRTQLRRRRGGQCPRGDWLPRRSPLALPTLICRPMSTACDTATIPSFTARIHTATTARNLLAVVP